MSEPRLKSIKFFGTNVASALCSINIQDLASSFVAEPNVFTDLQTDSKSKLDFFRTEESVKRAWAFINKTNRLQYK